MRFVRALCAVLRALCCAARFVRAMRFVRAAQLVSANCAARAVRCAARAVRCAARTLQQAGLSGAISALSRNLLCSGVIYHIGCKLRERQQISQSLTGCYILWSL